MIQIGDLIIFDDKHKLLCGDAIKKELKLLNGASKKGEVTNQTRLF